MIKRSQNCENKENVDNSQQQSFISSISKMNNNYFLHIFKRIKNNVKNGVISCGFEEIETIKRELASCRKALVDEMVICHGNALQTVLENKTKTKFLHKIVYTNVLKTFKTR